VSTSNFYAVQTKSWRSNGWRTDYDRVYQGRYVSGGSDYMHTGVCWFDGAAIKATLYGKIVDSIYIRLYRPDNHGISGSVLIYMGRNAYDTGLSSSPSSRDGYRNLGGFARGDFKWVAIDNTFAEGFRDNNDTCFVFYTSDTSDNGYAYFEGASSNDYKPYLEINYHDSTTGCNAPTACSLDNTFAEGNVTLSWSGASGGTSNSISAYEIQYSESADNINWTGWSGLTTVSTNSSSGSCVVSPSDIRGYYRRFQVRTQGTAGSSYYSGWKVSTNSVRKNSLPPTPTVIAPKEGSTTYNPNPRILLKTGTEVDGQRQNIQVKNANGVWESTAANTDLFSVSGWLGDNIPTDYRYKASSIGSKIVNFRSVEEGMNNASYEMSRTFLIAALTFTDILLTSGITHVKATHIQELRNAVNMVRDYYGLNAFAWSESIISGKTQIKNWSYHIQELRSAIDQIISLVNENAGTLDNLFISGNFEGSQGLSGWSTIGGGLISLSAEQKHGGTQAVKQTSRAYTYSSPLFNLYNIIKAKGTGKYIVKAWLYLKNTTTFTTQLRIRGDKDNPASFMSALDANNVAVSSALKLIALNAWAEMTVNFTVAVSDIANSIGVFNLCVDNIPAGTDIYIDDISVIKDNSAFVVPQPNWVGFTQGRPKAALIQQIRDIIPTL